MRTARHRLFRLGAVAGSAVGAVALLGLLGSTRAGADDTIPLPLKLPRAAFAGTPKDLPEGITDVEPVDTKRPLPQVPRGIAQLALKKGVTASCSVYSGSLEQVTDGTKEAYEDTSVELKAKLQYVQIDLGEAQRLYNICVWHFHLEPVIFHDVVIQISNDPTFKDYITVFNNDKDNSTGLGAGSSREYWDTNMGKLVGCNGVSARYVRCYSRGSTYSDPLNRYTEVEVWGLPN